MKITTIAKLSAIVIFFAGNIGFGTYFYLVSQIKTDTPAKTTAAKVAKTANKATVATADKLFGWKFPVAKFPLTGALGKLIAYSTIRDPGGIPQGLPVRLKIPNIGVDSAIEDALITPDGRMDVPAGSVNVAWFALGPHPGQTGSAVIGGHFGFENGVPFVFYKLNQVKIGDKIYIVDDKNDTLAFIVRSTKSFDRNADATTVFTSQDGLAHLNLITCEGVWNQVNGTYPQRLVVFADAIPSEGAVTVNKQAAAVSTPKIAIKATIIPTQTPTKTPAQPTHTTTNLSTVALAKADPQPISPSSPQMLIQSAKSVYATPLDGLITSVLLIAILFITYKIIRRKYLYTGSKKTSI